ncbi:peptidyl-prolyl cis-trans isomerase [Desulfuromonas acetoxidans]|uniref:Peptidyl-prolyl cis-trans isomerase n=1 Tax=Desulfuromonas acetoxidans (strain DSM 684 / 11070) TaxID=281689 RepID=Q1JZE7_DESA6|nr:Peptidylprolyl isomerase [Desulfuromonas acetoxidans DSM 684]MBF0645753.1 peptidyl-prolyl cis-trans isomerase [Desulfuromonas acetoxidans]NVD25213.1 peptidyl-prolyl cis-trans isomerase [Desulfuromonas acetoxidans]NVE17165.1 peptidyl-prolyl cis-trans isomerase [Desulfuromonas acetoxidans]
MMLSIQKIVFIALAVLIPTVCMAGPQVKMTTNYGPIVIELDDTHAPVSTNNFLRYTDGGFYNGTIFHRVIPGFMIQGGGFTQKMDRKVTRQPITNEATNGLKNMRGTIAMARTGRVDSATSQFFINLVDNAFLDHKTKTARGYGYAVFGKVIEGMDVVDKIAKVKTGRKKGMADVPSQSVIIESVERIAAP